MNDVASPQHLAAAVTIRRLLAAYQENEDLLSIGAYRRGSNRWVDAAVDMREPIDSLLCQAIAESLPLDQVVTRLAALAAQANTKLNTVPAATPAITPQAAGA